MVRSLCEYAPDHPVTRHLSVAYWKGGDESFERRFYLPANIEKILAWGGFASVKHVTKYVQPGLELISLDPKRSISVIGAETFNTEELMQAAAARVAADIGGLNQVGCVNARKVYLLTGTESAGLEKANRFGDLAYRAMMALPERFSTKPKSVDASLDNRVANFIPVDSIDEVAADVDAYTQTVGVYPEAFKRELEDVLPLYGAQRFVSLGYAVLADSAGGPQDGIEPIRRMTKWIVDENCDALDREVHPPPWAD